MKSYIKTLLALTFLFIIPFCISAQELTTKSKKAIEAYQNGIRFYNLFNHAGAERELLLAIKEDEKFIEAYLVLAEVYEDWKKPAEAIAIYKKGLQLKEKFYPYGYIRMANLQFNEGFYEDALFSYQHFLSLESGNISHDTRAETGVVRCKFALHALKNPVNFQPVNLGKAVNSTSDDYWPTLSADETTLVITRLVPSEEFMKDFQEDFYISRRNDTTWGPMVNAGKPLNTTNNEGAQTISGDGRYMIFTACNRGDGIGRCDLYYSVKEGDTWSVPQNLGGPVNTKYRETQPSITPDGRTLFFSSDRPGGIGLHDIWVSYRDNNGLWSDPQNLGEPVNTPGIEMSPFIHPDNRSLYFSSEGHIGLGGYDLFVSRSDSTGVWQMPVNLGYPINTHRDEIGLILNSRGDKAYYSSDINKPGDKDIYMFDMPVEMRPLVVTYMKGKVFDAKDLHLLKAEFELIDLESGRMMFHSFSDSITGEFLVSIPVNRNYMLNVSKMAYLFYSENFSLKNTDASTPYHKDIPLQPLVAGSTIILNNVFFATDSYALKNESRLELNKVVRMLQTNPDIRIEIGGHTDNTGTMEYNQRLSENRAKSVTDYLVSEGIQQGRIISKGYASNQPVADNETSEGKALNRRTEMKVIE